MAKVQRCFSRLYRDIHLSTSVFTQTVSTCTSRGLIFI